MSKSSSSHHSRKARGPYHKPHRPVTIIAKHREFDEQRWIALLTAIAERSVSKSPVKRDD